MTSFLTNQKQSFHTPSLSSFESHIRQETLNASEREFVHWVDNNLQGISGCRPSNSSLKKIPYFLSVPLQGLFPVACCRLCLVATIQISNKILHLQQYVLKCSAALLFILKQAAHAVMVVRSFHLKFHVIFFNGEHFQSSGSSCAGELYTILHARIRTSNCLLQNFIVGLRFFTLTENIFSLYSLLSHLSSKLVLFSLHVNQCDNKFPIIRYRKMSSPLDRTIAL